MTGFRTVRFVANATTFLDRLVNILAAELFLTILVAQKTEVFFIFVKQARIIAGVRVVTSDTVPGSDWSMQVFVLTAIITVTFPAQSLL
jgi:hypothetical protein